jgi:hypothetical protein
MRKSHPQHEPTVKFQISGPSSEAAKQLSAKSFAKAIAKDTQIISSHKIKRK